MGFMQPCDFLLYGVGFAAEAAGLSDGTPILGVPFCTTRGC